MLFNSLSFLIFLPIVFILYWSINKKNIRLQNLLLLVASYYFYSCWDWRFLFLLLFSTGLDYLYIPLGGIKGSMWQKVRNTFIIFIVTGMTSTLSQ